MFYSADLGTVNAMGLSIFRWETCLVFLFALSSVALGQTKFETPFFQKVTGDWIGDGELVNANGEITVIHEEWSGKETEDGTYLVSGSRLMGEENQEFRWEYTFNPTLDFYECEYWHSGMDESMRFEVSLTADSAELRAPLGDPGSELKIRNDLVDDGIEGHITLTDANGQEIVTGLVTHHKVN